MAEAAKKRKVFDIAKELKVTSNSIVEYLEARGLDVSRKAMQPVEEEIYLDLLRKFDPVMFQKIQTEQASAREESKKTDSMKLRKEELDKIMVPKEFVTPAPRKKITLPIYKQVIVEPAPVAKPAKSKATLATEAQTEEKTKAATRVKVESEVVPIEKTKPGEIESKKPSKPWKKIDLTQKAEPPKPRERATSELPKIIEQAAAKPKKLKRKKIVSVDESPIEAIETQVVTKLERDTGKLPKGKVPAKKGDSPVAEAPSRRRRRRKRSRSGSGVDSGAKAAATKRRTVDAQEVAATIKQTMAKISGPIRQRRRHTKGTDGEAEIGEAGGIRVTEYLTTQELAEMIEISVSEIIRKALEMGMAISINQRLERDQIELLAAEFHVDIEFVQEIELEEDDEFDAPVNLTRRPPVVTVMGHVDHGKTTLLDYLRRTRVAEKEVGGITQHIGAYEVVYNKQEITFLDTPGHEAFTAMRARGAQLTDIVVLVVAADDKVMPQTVEAIDHARAAGVPIVIAVNKIDKPGINPEGIYKQLADNNILVEKWGGKYQSTEISAKFGQGVDDLLAEILVATELLDLKADASIRARGVVVESRLDKGLGAVATILIQSGTLCVSDPFTIGQHFGRVRSMFNEWGHPVTKAGPSTPVQVVGFNGVPQAADKLVVQQSEKVAREVSLKRQRQQREISFRQIKALSLDQVNRRMKEQSLKDLPLIIKGDVHGSVEVLSDALMKLSNLEVRVNIVHRGVGGISEADVLLAAASGAIIIGFHVHPNPQAREVARREGVEIRIYRIIYEVVEDIHKSLEGLLTPDQEERHQGTVEIRQVFKISRQGNVAGCYVSDGKISRRSKVRVVRDDVELWTGQLSSLRRFKDDAREVASGFECGLQLDGFNDIREGDRLEAFEVVELARKLEDIA